MCATLFFVRRIKKIPPIILLFCILSHFMLIVNIIIHILIIHFGLPMVYYGIERDVGLFTVQNNFLWLNYQNRLTEKVIAYII